MELYLNDKLGKITIEMDESPKASSILIVAHGAGAGMHHFFMKEIAQLISNEGITVVRFNFPYMEQGRKSPGSPKSNIETWNIVIEHILTMYPEMPIVVSGKSYGGRMASHLLAEHNFERVKGIIYFGFPLHAPGKDSKDRAQHLCEITLPQLFLQGSKDKLANLDLMKEVMKSLHKAEIRVIEDADHSFHVPKRSGKTKEEILLLLATESINWIRTNL
ncbi:alpha/beta hydrolase family protein [Ekhidna sp.]